MRNEMENNVITEILLELSGARPADLVDIWLTNDAPSRRAVVNDHRNVKHSQANAARVAYDRRPL